QKSMARPRILSIPEMFDEMTELWSPLQRLKSSVRRRWPHAYQQKNCQQQPNRNEHPGDSNRGEERIKRPFTGFTMQGRKRLARSCHLCFCRLTSAAPMPPASQTKRSTSARPACAGIGSREKSDIALEGDGEIREGADALSLSKHKGSYRLASVRT